MRQANKRKRSAPKAQENENIQPALVNSAVASAADPLPEGNRDKFLNDLRGQREKLMSAARPTERREMGRFVAEFERRSRAMPFLRFVANGEDLPLEIGNVDKLQALDGSGTYYMFPTSENLEKSYGGSPEDPTQGQEAQGGPLQSITGRGEKYAGGNVETSVVAKEFQNAQAEGKGSQTGGKGIQRAALGDAAAIGGAVEDYGDGRLRPLAPGTVIEQVGRTNEDEPGIIRRTTDASKLTNKGGLFRVAKEQPREKTPRANIKSGQDHLMTPLGEVKPGEPTVVDTRFADTMKEGQKTATDAAAAGAVTAGNSASDIEEKSPGVLAGFGGKQSADASEGTIADIRQPTVDPLELTDSSLGVYYAADWGTKDDKEIIDFLHENGVRVQTGVTRTDLEAMAKGVETKKAGDALAYQKSDEATPQTAGGVLVRGANARTDEEGETKTTKADKREARKAKRSTRKTARKSKAAAKKTTKGTTMKIGGKGKTEPSTSKPANKPDAASPEEAKASEPGEVKSETDEKK